MAGDANGQFSSVLPTVKVKRPVCFLNLPIETQKEIISHCSQGDLICLALVSKHFHRLASAELYRCFHIIFPDEDDLHFDSPIDGLASGLDTFTTSEYNYAQHLRDLFMDTLTSGIKGELAYQSYLYNTSCGKFFNNLLYLTLKKAKSLESFRWNIRVELSRSVYKELHRIPSLKKLQVRLQQGESYYVPPPPLPVSQPAGLALLFDPSTSSSLHNISHHGSLNGLASHAGAGAPAPMHPPPPPPPGLSAPSRSLPKSKIARRGPPCREPPTFSGFKNLRSLSILDIDDLDVVTEIRGCVRNSSSTLRELDLSFSASLAQRARNPSRRYDDSYHQGYNSYNDESEDEFLSASPHSSNHDAAGPTRPSRADEERRVQDAVLGRIFELEHYRIKDQEKAEVKFAQEQDQRKEDESARPSDPRQAFLSSIQGASRKLMTAVNGSSTLLTSRQNVLDTIYQASKKYVESAQPPRTVNMARRPKEQRRSSSEEEYPRPAHWRRDQTSTRMRNQRRGGGPSRDPSSSPGATDLGAFSSTHRNMLPEESWSPIEEFEGDEELEEQTRGPILLPGPSGFNEEQPTSPRATDIAIANLTAQRLNFETLVAQLDRYQCQAVALGDHLEDIRLDRSRDRSDEEQEKQAELQSLHESISEVLDHIKVMEAEVNDAAQQVPAKARAATTEMVNQCMNDYIRDTRGLPLESLQIHLIPAKATVLSQSINFHCLKKLTLLNVGNQAPIWKMLTKENEVRPLPLRSILTDNVSLAFLTCMSHLEEIHDLYMLEPTRKQRPESLAPATDVTIDQIRRLVLSKHLPNMRRLMIKDFSEGIQWDVNEKTMMQICVRGVRLEELAVGMNINAVHALMQYMPSLLQLRAIHILYFRNRETCVWVIRELLNFIVDNLSHNPHLKLEWVAMEDERVDRIVRPAEYEAVIGQNHRSERQSASRVPHHPGHHPDFPVMPPVELESESETDDESVVMGSRLRFKTIGPLQLYDVWGVKIFEKEMISGTL